MKVLTTGQVAKICYVAPRTVAKWFDRLGLRGYRIPGSQDRRIPRHCLIEFLLFHGMPLGALTDSDIRKIVLISDDSNLEKALRSEMTSENRYRFAAFRSTVEAGAYASTTLTDCYIVDFTFGITPALNVSKTIRRKSLNPTASIVALTRFPLEKPPRGLFADIIPWPFEPGYLIERVKSLTPLD